MRSRLAFISRLGCKGCTRNVCGGGFSQVFSFSESLIFIFSSRECTFSSAERELLTMIEQDFLTINLGNYGVVYNVSQSQMECDSGAL